MITRRFESFRAALLPLLCCAAATQHVDAQNARLRMIADAVVESTVPSEDNPDAIAAKLLTAAHGAATSPASSIAIDRAARYVGRFADPTAILRLLDQYQDANPHGLGAQGARVLKQRILRRIGNREAAVAVKAYESFASHFLVIGPFGDAGDDYTGVPFDPELTFPNSEQKLAGRFGEVSVRVVRRKAHRPNVRLRLDSAPEQTGCFYALHQVRAEVATACYAEVITEGSFELFVNDERVTQVLRAAARTPDRGYIPIRLGAGTNHVLLKTTETSNDDISLRYVNAAGHPIELVELTPQQALPRDARSAEAPQLGTLLDDCTVLLRATADAPPQDRALFAIATMLTCLERGHVDSALDTLTSFDDAEPADARLRVALAAAIDRTTVLPRELRASRTRALIESARDALPDHHYTQLRLSRLLVDEDRREDAIRQLQARLERFPREATTYSNLHSLLRGLRFEAEANSVLETWTKRLPHDTRPVLTLARDLASNGSPRAALDLVNTAMVHSPGATTLMRRALDLAVELGEPDLRDQMLDKLYADDPGSLPAQRMRARMLHESGDAEAALAIDERIATHPEAGTAAVRGAAMRLARGDRSKAAHAAYDRVLAADPSRHSLRRLIRRIRGDEAEFPLMAKFERNAREAIAKFKPTDRERGSSSTLLIDQMIVRFFEDGSSVQYVHELRRINDLRGVDAYEEARGAANADEVITVRTILPSGDTFVPNRVQGSFQMPRLEPGAFIEQAYREFKPAPREEPWRSSLFYFQSYDEPFLLSEYVVILPPDHEGTLRMRNFDGAQERTELPGGYTAHVFRKTDVPRLETESLAPQTGDVVPVVTFGEDRTLAPIARTAFRQANQRARTSPWVHAKVEEICKGVNSDLAQARAIHRWVHETIPQSRGSADPTAILLRSQGPRFFLLVAMLQNAGIPLRHAIAQPAIEGYVDEAKPMFDGEDEFPVPCVRVEPRDAAPFWIFVDNARYEPMGSIAPERRGAAAMLLDVGRYDLTRLPGGDRFADLGWQFRGALTVNQNGGAEFSVRGVRLGDSGYGLADQIRDIPESHRTVVARQVATQVVPGWTHVKSEITGLEPGGRLTANATLERRTAVQAAGDEHLLPLPLVPLQLVASMADKSERSLPLKLTNLDADDWSISIDPGEHYRIASLPPRIDYRSAIIDYSLSFAREGDKVRVTRRMAQRPGTVPPAEYDEWRRMLQAIDLAEQAKIGLRKR